MAKNSSKQIIEDERKIIEELTKNANKSINEIAKTCGFSRQKVWRVIKNLEKNNVIWGYTAVIDKEKQNLKGFMVLLKRTNKPIQKQMIEKVIGGELAKRAKKHGIKMTDSIYTNGAYDWVICFSAKDIQSAKKFVEILGILFEGHIAEIELIESLFVARQCGLKNPDLSTMRKFFVDLA